MRLKHLKLNPTDLCNLKCVFCPRYDDEVYPNVNNHMSLETLDTILDGLKKFKEPFYFGMVGHSEPMLVKNFDIFSTKIHLAKKQVPNMKTYLITNGVRMKRHLNSVKLYDQVIYDVYTDDEDYFWEEMVKYKDISNITINMINSVGKSVLQYKEGQPLKPRPWVFTNRAGLYEVPYTKIDDPFPDFGWCMRPFSDIQINWNGDYTLCCEEWRNTPLDNVHNTSVYDYWTSNSKLNEYRESLNQGIRPHPCNLCDYPGHNDYMEGRTGRYEIIPEWQNYINKKLEITKNLPDLPVDNLS